MLEYGDEKRVSGAGEVGRVARRRLRGRVVSWWEWAWRLLLCWLVIGSAVWLCGVWSRGVKSEGGELSLERVGVMSVSCRLFEGRLSGPGGRGFVWGG